jgi:hypothetical protein
MKKILITGGTGTIGQRLIDHLGSTQEFEIRILSRNPSKDSKVKEYKWDIKNKFIDENALRVDSIIHLAGAGVADERWTEKRKKIILNSRTESTKLLREYISRMDKKPDSFISASAIGFYGSGKQDSSPVDENSEPGDDFLAHVVKKWEDEIFEFKKTGIRTAAVSRLRPPIWFTILLVTFVIS